MAGCKVQRSFEATADWQVIGRSGRSESDPAATAVDRLPDIGRKTTLNGSFLIAHPTVVDPERSLSIS